MTPAIECTICHRKARTMNEPASDDEMTTLIADYGNHAALCAADLTSLTPSESSHMAVPQYYEETPTQGFENAVVVKGTK